MGNHKFRLSDMMPNAWFYKLKEIGTGKTTTTTRTSKTTTTRTSKTTKTKLPNIQNPPHPHPSFSSKSKPNPRKSYYFTRNVSPNSPSQFPRKSKSNNTKFNNKSSTISPPDHYSASSTSYTSPDSDLDSFRSDRILPTESFGGADSDDIIINVDTHSLTATFDKLELSDLHRLPPIITKSKPNVQFENTRKKKHKKESIQSSTKNNRPISRHVNSPGLRLRVNSPRFIGAGSRSNSRRISARKSVSSSSNSSNSSSLRSLSDSLAIVKSSFDPQRDFRESMVEMIVENNIRNSKDLEDLLACYLSLNADEYHQVIIKVFKQIWFDLTETPAKQ